MQALVGGSEQPFLVWTDHKNLQYLQTAKCLNSLHARWALFFNWINFHLSYRPGSKNTKLDALSRIHRTDPASAEFSYILPRSCIVGAVTWEIEEKVKHASQTVNVPSNCPQNRLFVVPKTSFLGHPLGSCLPFCMSTRCLQDSLGRQAKIVVADNESGCQKICTVMSGLH